MPICTARRLPTLTPATDRTPMRPMLRTVRRHRSRQTFCSSMTWCGCCEHRGRRLNGGRVRVSVGDRKRGGRTRETTFPKGTALRVMQKWQTLKRAAFDREQIRIVRGMLETDAATYLARPDVRSLASYKTRVCDIAAWYPRFGKM